jgi:uncharacterized protein YjbI with pentapeptide repeats
MEASGSPGEPRWTQCEQNDCIGARIVNGKCIAHADAEERDQVFRDPNRQIADYFRGVHITAELLSEALAAAPRDRQDRPVLYRANFTQAVFEDDAGLKRVVFDEFTSFEEVTFKKGAYFDQANFGSCSFYHARFEGDADFDGVMFGGATFFFEAYLGGKVSFHSATFKESVNFYEQTFRDTASFSGATFEGDADFTRAEFKGSSDFDRAVFRKVGDFNSTQFLGAMASFSEARFEGSRADFRGATFDAGMVRFDEMALPEDTGFLDISIKCMLFDLSRVSFPQFVALRVQARRMSCIRTRFLAGGHLQISLADITLKESEFPSPFIISGEPTRHPSIVSLQRTNVYALVLNGTNLRMCRFAGAHNLDRLRIEGAREFADSPHGWKLGRVGGQGLPIWRWTRRQALAEEHEWRRLRPLPEVPSGRIHPKKQGWYPTECQTPAWAGSHIALEPEEIASLYRSVRKGREDNKDEPGAADFYYGEMEMRRKAKSTASGERFILLVYWLLAGYGQRATRAFLTLLVTVLVASSTIAAIGIPRPAKPGLVGSVVGIPPSQRVNLESSTSSPSTAAPEPYGSRFLTASRVSVEAALFRSPDQELTPAGRGIQTALRIIGPVLLGLGILSIRGRVKR